MSATFNLPAGARLKLVKVTPRKEEHGKTRIQAISLRLEWWPEDNSLLNLLHENLQDLLFWTPPEVAQQCELDGIPLVKKHRRVPNLGMPLKLDRAFPGGYTLTIDHGIDASTALELYSCSLDKFEVDGKEGGAAAIRWSLASNKTVTPELVGALCDLEGTTVVATLTAPKPEEAAIDGSRDGGGPGFSDPPSGDGPLFDGEAAADDATAAFLAIHGDGDGPPDSDTDSGGGSDSEGGETDVSAEPAGKRRAGVRYRSPQTGETWSGRGLQPRWLKAALAAGRQLEEFAV